MSTNDLKRKPLRTMSSIESPSRRRTHKHKHVPSLDIKNMFSKLPSPRQIFNKISPSRSPSRSLNSSPARHASNVDLNALKSTSLSSSMTMSISPVSSSRLSACSSSGSVNPFAKKHNNYLSRSASNVTKADISAREYRHSNRISFDENHCYTCNVELLTQDGILLGLRCTCSSIKHFHNAYCLRVHWIYSRKCKLIHFADLQKPLTLEDVYNQPHLYDSAKSDSDSEHESEDDVTEDDVKNEDKNED